MEIKLTKKAKEKLRKLGVGVLYLIGSRATDTYRANSDFDYAVVMNKPVSFIEKHQNELHTQFYPFLSDITPRVKTNLPFPENLIDIDIIFLQTAPLYYAMEAIKHGKTLFEISPNFRATFEERVMIEYADMEPIMRAHDEAILARI